VPLKSALGLYSIASLAFISGSFLVFLGATQAPFLTNYSCFATFFSCPNSPFDLIFLVLGTVFVFLAFPVSKFRSGDGDASLIWNKKISGISLIISGVVLAIFSAVAFLFIPLDVCSVYGCPSIFNLGLIDNWIQVFSGISLIFIGVVLLALNARKDELQLIQEQEASTPAH
jgi:hypothetical protein